MPADSLPPDLKDAMEKLGTVLSEMIMQDVNAITHANMKGFMSAMVQHVNNSPLANQQLVYCMNDVQTCTRAMMNILVAKGICTQTELDEARLLAVRERVQQIQAIVTERTFIPTPGQRGN